MTKPRLRVNKTRPAKGGSWCSECLGPLYFWEIQNSWSAGKDFVHSCGRIIKIYKEPGK